MINKNSTFHHLVYYPNNTIDNKVYKIISELSLDKDVPINNFLYRLNFFLSITEQNLDFSSFNKKQLSTVIFSKFYTFLFGENNYFNDSKSNRLRYTKIFTKLEEILKININKNITFDFSKINKEQLNFFKGWFVTNQNKSVFVNLIPFYNVFGEDVTIKYFAKIEQFILSVGLKSFENNKNLVFSMITFVADKGKLHLTHEDIIKLMKDYFTFHQEQGHDINYKKSDWNWFIKLCNSLFNIDDHEQYILAKSHNTNTHIKIKNTKQVKTKLITEIPLEIYDNEAFDILFKKINQDITLIKQWADYTIDYHYQKFLNVKQDFKIQSTYFNLGIKEIAMLKFGKYDRITQLDLYDKDSYFNKNILYAIIVKLILNHPEITDSFISNFIYLDDKDNTVGISKTDQGTYLIGYKLRKGQSLAEQKILLNDETSKLISILLEMTNDIRINLKLNNNNLYKKLFIASNVNNLLVTDFFQAGFLVNKEPFNNIIHYLQNIHNISLEDSITYTKNISLTKIRASRGVQIYFETQSTTKMSQALGHTKYDPQLLSRYLPSPILDFFQRRWILLFQKGIICEAMKDSDFLLKASNFKDMNQLNSFLDKHTLKNIPNVSSKNNKPTKTDAENNIYISIDEDKIAALLSIGQAIENSPNINKVSSKAIYWKQLGEEIVKEINHNNTYSQYKTVVSNAKNKINPQLFSKVIYE